jgi:hypothetical protein
MVGGWGNSVDPVETTGSLSIQETEKDRRAGLGKAGFLCIKPSCYAGVLFRVESIESTKQDHVYL